MDFSSSSRYSVADVLEFLETSEDDLIDDEPIMEGSDDFEDLAVENTSENLEDSQQDAYTISPMHIPNSLVQPPPNNSLPQTPIPSAQTSTPPSTQTSTVWSTNLHPVVIYPFTEDLLHLIVQQYASQVMDQAACAKWGQNHCVN